ncbi:MAG: cytochrome P450 [Pirellulaceae bacterium]
MSAWLHQVPGYRRLSRLPRQLLGVNPFDGDNRPSRVRVFFSGSGRPTVPFPHPWNYDEPIRILETYFWGAEREEGPGRHNRYLDFPGFAPVLVTRDPGVIRAILTSTGDREGQFDRDTLPSTGIARATGKDTLLFANGSTWRSQRKAAASPFGKTSLFQLETFHEFEETFRRTVGERLALLRQRLQADNRTTLRIAVEIEIKALMLEMLVNCFFGARVGYDEIRNDYVPALERVIDHIVRDTVTNRLGLSAEFLSRFNRRFAQVAEDAARFEELTDVVLAARRSGEGLWSRFKSDAPSEALRSNIKVFLAGALEATTSYAAWAVSHLSRNPEAQEQVFQEVKNIEAFTPEHLEAARHLGHVLDETLRLTPSLYFLPRRATADTWIETADGRKLRIPSGTHILLDVWHANRHDDHWGERATGYAAEQFAPQRWENLGKEQRRSKEMLHFGFGHGARVCPGKHLGQLEVALVVGAFVKLFRFQAVNADCGVKAGVSTKPLDGVLLDLELRQSTPPPSQPDA